jgi:hypothetical protein
MDYPIGKTGFSKRDDSGKYEPASLKEVPLEVRREEAKKPLFLTRYE